jgi:hypothetical protein
MAKKTYDLLFKLLLIGVSMEFDEKNAENRHNKEMKKKKYLS